jgi:hypothetical protein
MKPERPPEPWLYKVHDGDVLIDLIFSPSGLEVTDEVIERSDELEVFAIPLRVMRPEDLLVTKLCAMTEHTINFRSCLEIARALREQIDWEDVRRRTDDSPFARAFFTLVEGLGIVDPDRRLSPRQRGSNGPRWDARSGGPAGASPSSGSGSSTTVSGRTSS